MLRNIFFTLVALFLGAPLVVIAGVSFNAQNRLSFPPQGWAWRWYQAFWQDPQWLRPAASSLTIAALAALLALSIALPLAYVTWRYRFGYARFLYGLGLAPFALPPVITALGLLTLWIALGVYGRPFTVVASHGVFLVTLPLATITLGLQAIDKEILEAATTMGATKGQVFRSVIVPLIRPYLIAGYLFAFVLSLNEYIIAFMTVGFTVETLPMRIFNSLRYGYTPIMAVVSVLFFLGSALIFSLVGIFGDLPKLLGAYSSRD